MRRPGQGHPGQSKKEKPPPVLGQLGDGWRDAKGWHIQGAARMMSHPPPPGLGHPGEGVGGCPGLEHPGQREAASGRPPGLDHPENHSSGLDHPGRNQHEDPPPLGADHPGTNGRTPRT